MLVLLSQAIVMPIYNSAINLDATFKLNALPWDLGREGENSISFDQGSDDKGQSFAGFEKAG